MTPKEKAAELIKKYAPLAYSWDCGNDKPLEENNEVKCALIAVQEVIDELITYSDLESIIIQHGILISVISLIGYWQEVRTELIKRL